MILKPFVQAYKAIQSNLKPPGFKKIIYSLFYIIFSILITVLILNSSVFSQIHCWSVNLTNSYEKPISKVLNTVFFSGFERSYAKELEAVFNEKNADSELCDNYLYSKPTGIHIENDDTVLHLLCNIKAILNKKMSSEQNLNLMLSKIETVDELILNTQTRYQKLTETYKDFFEVEKSTGSSPRNSLITEKQAEYIHKVEPLATNLQALLHLKTILQYVVVNSRQNVQESKKIIEEKREKYIQQLDSVFSVLIFIFVLILNKTIFDGAQQSSKDTNPMCPQEPSAAGGEETKPISLTDTEVEQAKITQNPTLEKNTHDSNFKIGNQADHPILKTIAIYTAIVTFASTLLKPIDNFAREQDNHLKMQEKNIELFNDCWETTPGRSCFDQYSSINTKIQLLSNTHTDGGQGGMGGQGGTGSPIKIYNDSYNSSSTPDTNSILIPHLPNITLQVPQIPLSLTTNPIEVKPITLQGDVKLGGQINSNTSSSQNSSQTSNGASSGSNPNPSTIMPKSKAKIPSFLRAPITKEIIWDELSGKKVITAEDLQFAQFLENSCQVQFNKNPNKVEQCKKAIKTFRK